MAKPIIWSELNWARLSYLRGIVQPFPKKLYYFTYLQSGNENAHMITECTRTIFFHAVSPSNFPFRVEVMCQHPVIIAGTLFLPLWYRQTLRDGSIRQYKQKNVLQGVLALIVGKRVQKKINKWWVFVSNIMEAKHYENKLSSIISVCAFWNT